MTGQRMLVLELGGIGDVVMAIPALEAILNHYKDVYIKILCVHRTLPIIEYLRNRVNNPFSIESVEIGGGLTNWLNLVRRLRNEQYDTVIDLSAIETFRAAIKRYVFLESLGAHELIGRNTDGRGWGFTKKTSDALFSSEHEVERKLNVAKLSGADVKEHTPKIEIYESNEKILNNFLEKGDTPIVGISIGTYKPSKRWPVDKVITLSRDLLKEMTLKIVFLGGEREKGILELISNSFSDRQSSIGIAMNLPFKSLVGSLKRLSLLITNDTALMHIGAALNIPMVITFDQTNIYRYHPYMGKERYILIKKDTNVCPYFRFKHEMEECPRYSCDTQECMSLITVEEVKEAVQKLLSKTRGKSC